MVIHDASVRSLWIPFGSLRLDSVHFVLFFSSQSLFRVALWTWIQIKPHSITCGKKWLDFAFSTLLPCEMDINVLVCLASVFTFMQLVNQFQWIAQCKWHGKHLFESHHNWIFFNSYLLIRQRQFIMHQFPIEEWSKPSFFYSCTTSTINTCNVN